MAFLARADMITDMIADMITTTTATPAVYSSLARPSISSVELTAAVDGAPATCRARISPEKRRTNCQAKAVLSKLTIVFQSKGVLRTRHSQCATCGTTVVRHDICTVGVRHLIGCEVSAVAVLNVHQRMARLGESNLRGRV